MPTYKGTLETDTQVYEEFSRMRTCEATTARGTPCKIPPTDGNSLCGLHADIAALPEPNYPGESVSSRRRRERLEQGPAKPRAVDAEKILDIQRKMRTPLDIRANPKVYVIQIGETGPIKIGITQNIGNRKSDLQVSNPEQLHVRHLFHIGRGVHAVEQYLHQLCAEYAIHGEWFEADALKLIEKIVNDDH